MLFMSVFAVSWSEAKNNNNVSCYMISIQHYRGKYYTKITTIFSFVTYKIFYAHEIWLWMFTVGWRVGEGLVGRGEGKTEGIWEHWNLFLSSSLHLAIMHHEQWASDTRFLTNLETTQTSNLNEGIDFFERSSKFLSQLEKISDLNLIVGITLDSFSVTNSAREEKLFWRKSKRWK